MQVEGTPLALGAALDPIEFVRTIAVARITMPRSMVRLSAGREDMTDEMQALCFLAGANSIFYGPKLLTTPNPAADRDRQLMDRLGLRAMRGVTGRATVRDPADWYRSGLDHVWLPYAQMKTAPPPLPVVRTEGTRIHLADGRELIDGIALVVDGLPRL